MARFSEKSHKNSTPKFALRHAAQQKNRRQKSQQHRATTPIRVPVKLVGGSPEVLSLVMLCEEMGYLLLLENWRTTRARCCDGSFFFAVAGNSTPRFALRHVGQEVLLEVPEMTSVPDAQERVCVGCGRNAPFSKCVCASPTDRVVPRQFFQMFQWLAPSRFLSVWRTARGRSVVRCCRVTCACCSRSQFTMREVWKTGATYTTRSSALDACWDHCSQEMWGSCSLRVTGRHSMRRLHDTEKKTLGERATERVERSHGTHEAGRKIRDE